MFITRLDSPLLPSSPPATRIMSDYLATPYGADADADADFAAAQKTTPRKKDTKTKKGKRKRKTADSRGDQTADGLAKKQRKKDKPSAFGVAPEDEAAVVHNTNPPPAVPLPSTSRLARPVRKVYDSDSEDMPLAIFDKTDEPLAAGDVVWYTYFYGAGDARGFTTARIIEIDANSDDRMVILDNGHVLESDKEVKRLATATPTGSGGGGALYTYTDGVELEKVNTGELKAAQLYTLIAGRRTDVPFRAAKPPTAAPGDPINKAMHAPACSRSSPSAPADDECEYCTSDINVSVAPDTKLEGKMVCEACYVEQGGGNKTCFKCGCSGPLWQCGVPATWRCDGCMLLL